MYIIYLWTWDLQNIYLCFIDIVCYIFLFMVIIHVCYSSNGATLPFYMNELKKSAICKEILY